MKEIDSITTTVSEPDPETGLPIEREAIAPDPEQSAGCREVRWDAERGKYVGIEA